MHDDYNILLIMWITSAYIASKLLTTIPIRLIILCGKSVENNADNSPVAVNNPCEHVNNLFRQFLIPVFPLV